MRKAATRSRGSMANKPEVSATFDQLDAIVAKIGRVAYGNPSTMTFTEFCERTLPFKMHPWQRIVCDKLDEAYRVGGKRILVHAPPRAGKTILLSQRYPAWLFGMDPTHRAVLASFNKDNAIRHSIVARDMVNSEEYKSWFPETRLPAQTQAEAYSTTAMLEKALGEVNFAAVGIETNFVGKGADTLIVDDPYPNYQEAMSKSYNQLVWNWWENVVNVRVHGQANKIVMFHRWHDDDFAAKLLASGTWDYLRFPVRADDQGNDLTDRKPGEKLSDLWSDDYLDALEKESPRAYLSLFQGTPRPPEGAYIKKDYFQTSTVAPRLKQWVRYFDLATSIKTRADFTACALVGVDEGQNMYVKDMKRWKAEWGENAPRILEVIEEDIKWCKKEGARYLVGIDSRSMQLALFQDLVRRASHLSIPVLADQSKGSKPERIDGWVGRAAAGKLFLIPGWNHQAFIDEALSYVPESNVGHDDLLDALAGAYGILWSTYGKTIKDTKPLRPGTPEYFDALFDGIARENARRDRRS
jgi:phage terminase large subunit-like protein